MFATAGGKCGEARRKHRSESEREHSKLMISKWLTYTYR